MTRTLRSIVAALTAVVTGALLGVVGVGVAATPAAAAAVTDFEAGYIISDSVMYDATTMSADSVQAFLDVKGAGCAAPAGNTCIKYYGESTPTRPADALCPSAYVGVASESAAQIIAKSALACGINPQVLLVTLQKEQGLITASAGKSAATYARALGFGCPDNAGGQCNPEYAGFANQVYSAAKQLKRYAANPTGYSYRAGRTNTIQWHPNTACGTSSVYIENQATASLYNYTPYRPNGAALAAGYGTGDACSSYGNRNFHLYFGAWFGSAKQRPPIGTIDFVRDIGSNVVQVAGWALDRDVVTPLQVHVYVDGVAVLATTASRSRPDVDAAYGLGAAHGYDAQFRVATGAHDVCLYAIDGNGGTNVLLGCRAVTVVNHSPVGVIDVVRASGTDSLQVAGWALDPDTSTPTQVHVYVDGVAVAASTASRPRADVAAAYGLGPDHGFDMSVRVASGTHEVCVYALDTSGGVNVLLGCRRASVTNRTPLGTIDVVREVGGTAIQVAGWTLDPDGPGPIAVHVYVDGKGAAVVSAARPRPDVEAIYRNGADHGFDLTVPVAAGPHDVCVYAIDSGGGTNVLLGCRAVRVGNQLPLGVVDVVRDAGGGQVQVAGWVLDPDVTTSVDVHVYVDGVGAAAFTASNSRPDVDAAYSRGPNHGFDARVPAGVGQHTVCLYGLDADGGTNVLLGCRGVTVA